MGWICLKIEQIEVFYCSFGWEIWPFAELGASILNRTIADGSTVKALEVRMISEDPARLLGEDSAMWKPVVSSDRF